MKIIVDGFGGDNAPLAVLQGCELAVKEYGVEIVVTGDEGTLKKTAQENGISLEHISFHHAPSVITMEDEPTSILKEKADCSMAAAFQLVKDGKGDAFVSAGNTGAILVGATFLLKRIKGVKRAALASVIPTATGCYLLMDCGANVECRPEILTQFGVMGSLYMKKVMKTANPKVGLINIGSEETKGGELQIAALAQMKEAPINFTGNVEARDIPKGVCDVIVCEAFVGNVILKLYEGVGSTLISKVKSGMMSTLRSKIGALLVKPALKETLKSFDASQYGGAPLLGLKGLVVKSHGSSKAQEIHNSILQCITFTREDICGKIRDHITTEKKEEA